jgi:hypothetical protein
MTTSRTHTCNLCRGLVVGGTGVGLLWKTWKEISLTTPGNAETHVCQECLDALEAALGALREHERIRAELAKEG